MPRNPDLLAAFWSKVDATRGVDACWPWRGNRQDDGYGRLQSAGHAYYAHRVALSIALGRPIAAGLFACHRCDNPPCVNPAHLFEGTAGDNLHDSMTKGRWQTKRGVLSPAVIQAIRADGDPRDVVAARHGISVRTVYRILADDNYGQWAAAA